MNTLWILTGILLHTTPTSVTTSTQCRIEDGRRICRSVQRRYTEPNPPRYRERRTIRRAAPPRTRRVVRRRVYTRRPSVVVVSPPGPVTQSPAPTQVQQPNRVPVTHRTLQGLGLSAGRIGGTGIAYRAHLGRFGLQLGGSLSNIGAQVMLDLVRTRGMRFYLLSGIGHLLNSENLPNQQPDGQTTMLGAGLGAEVHFGKHLGLSLDLPLTTTPESLQDNRLTNIKTELQPSLSAVLYF